MKNQVGTILNPGHSVDKTNKLIVKIKITVFCIKKFNCRIQITAIIEDGSRKTSIGFNWSLSSINWSAIELFEFDF